MSEGHFGAAVKILSATPMAPASLETAHAVQSLFPEGPAPVCLESEGPSLLCGKDELLGALRRFKVGTAPGRDGLRVRHLLDALLPSTHGLGAVLVDHVVGLINSILRGNVPSAILASREFLM